MKRARRVLGCAGVILYLLAALALAFWACVGWYGYLYGFNPWIVAPTAIGTALVLALVGWVLRLASREAGWEDEPPAENEPSDPSP